MQKWYRSLPITRKLTVSILMIELLVLVLMYQVIEVLIQQNITERFQQEIILFSPKLGVHCLRQEEQNFNCREHIETRTGFSLLKIIELNAQKQPTAIDGIASTENEPLPKWLGEQLDKTSNPSSTMQYAFDVSKENGKTIGKALIWQDNFLPDSETNFLFLKMDISNLNLLSRNIWITYTITTFVLIFTTYFIIWRLVLEMIKKPFHQATNALDAIAGGEFTVRLDPHDRKDEIGHLFQGINQMADQLEEMFSEVSYQMEEQRTLSNELLIREQEIKALNESLEERVLQRTEELQQANRDLEAFSYSVSHDLRQPIQIISGYVDILDSSSPQTEKYIHSMGVIRQNLQYMESMIQDILILSRAGRSKLEISPVDTQSMVSMILDMQTVRHPDNTFEISTSELPVIEADPTLLQQIFQNLISNAIKFSLKAPISKIEVGYHQKDNEKYFFVRDNGVGFDPKKSEEVFTVFQRLHAAKDFPGNGIGLSIVKRAIERHEGSIWVETEIGQGSCFMFTLCPATDPGPD